MQAIVLVGGEGTRLRPLTSSVPKPALTLVDRPFLAYMVEWLASHGVTEVVLACGFLPDVLREALEGADAAVLVTEWPEFAELDWVRAAASMARPLLVDGRNFLDPGTLRAAGFAYEGIGRATEASPSPTAAD